MGLRVAVSRGCLRISWLHCSQVWTLSSLGISIFFEMQSNIFVCGSQARRGACSALCFAVIGPSMRRGWRESQVLCCGVTRE